MDGLQAGCALSPVLHPRGILGQSISVGLLTQASSYLPAFPFCCVEQWHLLAFVSYYSCGAVADLHRLPNTEILIEYNGRIFLNQLVFLKDKTFFYLTCG